MSTHTGIALRYMATPYSNKDDSSRPPGLRLALDAISTRELAKTGTQVSPKMVASIKGLLKTAYECDMFALCKVIFLGDKDEPLPPPNRCYSCLFELGTKSVNWDDIVIPFIENLGVATTRKESEWTEATNEQDTPKMFSIDGIKCTAATAIVWSSLVESNAFESEIKEHLKERANGRKYQVRVPEESYDLSVRSISEQVCGSLTKALNVVSESNLAPECIDAIRGHINISLSEVDWHRITRMAIGVTVGADVIVRLTDGRPLEALAAKEMPNE